MSFSAEHADALADVTANGASVTFTYATAGTYDAATDSTSGSSNATVTGAALQVKGRPATYQALELIESEAPTLLFVPTTYGDTPPLGSSVSWSGVTYTVRNVEPVAPDGAAIIARVVIGR